MGGLVKTIGAIREGIAQKAAAEFQAKQLEAIGLAEQAASSVRAGEQVRQGKLLASQAQAISAAGGGGMDVERIAEIESEGQYRSLLSLWEGEEARKGRQLQAKAAKVEGKNAMSAGLFNAAGSLVDTGTSLIEKYG